MSQKYLDKAGLQIVWDKTKEIVNAVDDKAVSNAAAIEELNTKVAVLEANGYDDTEVRELINAKLDKSEFQEAWEQHTADINHLNDTKANAADVYTKTEADGLLAAKANVADVETKEDAAAKLTEAKDYTDAAIESLLGEDVSEAYDTFKEIQTYIETHGTEAQGMVTSINQNTADIEALEGAVATKVEQSVYEAKIGELADVDADLDERIAALEAKHGDGEGTVESLIATAKAEAIAEAKEDASNKDAVVLSEAQKYTDAEIDKVELTINTLQGVVDGKAATSDLNAAVERVAKNEEDIANLASSLDAFTPVTSAEIEALFAE